MKDRWIKEEIERHILHYFKDGIESLKNNDSDTAFRCIATAEVLFKTFSILKND